MNYSPDPYAIAKEYIDEFEAILEVSDLTEKINNLNNSTTSENSTKYRDVGLGDVVGAASLLIGLISLVIQIRLGNTFQGESDETVTERLILKLSAETSLPPKTRERLVSKLIDIKYNIRELD